MYVGLNGLSNEDFLQLTGSQSRYTLFRPSDCPNNLTLSCEMPKWLAAARSLIPTRYTKSTLPYNSMV